MTYILAWIVSIAFFLLLMRSRMSIPEVTHNPFCRWVASMTDRVVSKNMNNNTMFLLALFLLFSGTLVTLYVGIAIENMSIIDVFFLVWKIVLGIFIVSILGIFIGVPSHSSALVYFQRVSMVWIGIAIKNKTLNRMQAFYFGATLMFLFFILLGIVFLYIFNMYVSAVMGVQEAVISFTTIYKIIALNLMAMSVSILKFFSYAIIINVLSTWIQRTPSEFMSAIDFYVEPYLSIFRRVIPTMGMFDISPIAGLVFIQFLVYVITSGYTSIFSAL